MLQASHQNIKITTINSSFRSEPIPRFPPTVLTRVDMHATSGSTSKISPWEDLSKTLSPATRVSCVPLALCRLDLSVWMVGNCWLWSKQISDQWGEPMQEFPHKSKFIFACVYQVISADTSGLWSLLPEMCAASTAERIFASLEGAQLHILMGSYGYIFPGQLWAQNHPAFRHG